MRKICSLLSAFILLSACGSSTEKKESTTIRAISVAGVITESLYALGWGNHLVAVDVTSTYPESTQALAQLGHASGITAEGILAQRPTHLFALDGSLKQDVLDQCKKAGLEILLFPTPKSIEDAKSLLKQLGTATDQKDKAEVLIASINSRLSEARTIQPPKKVLFIYSRGATNLMVSGSDTPVASMIALSGAQNAITEFTGYKPLNSEYLLHVQPDALLFFDTGWQAIGGLGGCETHPVLSQLDAVKNNHIITMDGGLLNSFGPRVAEAIEELHTKLKSIQ